MDYEVEVAGIYSPTELSDSGKSATAFEGSLPDGKQYNAKIYLRGDTVISEILALLVDLIIMFFTQFFLFCNQFFSVRIVIHFVDS